MKVFRFIRCEGVTLIELMVVVAIVAIALSIGLPNFSTWMQNQRIRTATESVLSGMQLARSEAVRRNTTVVFDLAADGGWNVGCAVPSATCPATIQRRSAADSGTREISVASEDGTTISFDGLGRMTAPMPDNGVNVAIDFDTPVLDAAESRDLRIIVNVAGAVRMCDPNVTSDTDVRKC